MADTIRVVGLKEFQKSLKQMDSDLPKALRIGLNKAATIIADDARPKVPRKSGKAAASIKTRSTQTVARVFGGGNNVEYFPFLDFGGYVGRGKKGRNTGSVYRKWMGRPVGEGRYLWKSFGDKHDEVFEAINDALVAVAKQAGLEVTHTNG